MRYAGSGLPLFSETQRQRGGMHYARLENSPRLQRALAVLERGGRFTTRQLQTEAQLCAVNTAVDELRANGIDVRCECVGRGRYEYWIARNPGDGAEHRLTLPVAQTGAEL